MGAIFRLMGAIFRLAEPNKAHAGRERNQASHRTGPLGLVISPCSATKPTACPGWGEGCNGRRAGGAGCSPAGASAPQSALHARHAPSSSHRCSAAFRCPGCPQHGDTSVPPQPGPCPGKGGEQALLCECRGASGPGKFNSLLPIFVLARRHGLLEETGQGEGSKHPLHSL